MALARFFDVLVGFVLYLGQVRLGWMWTYSGRPRRWGGCGLPGRWSTRWRPSGRRWWRWFRPTCSSARPTTCPPSETSAQTANTSCQWCHLLSFSTGLVPLGGSRSLLILFFSFQFDWTETTVLADNLQLLFPAKNGSLFFREKFRSLQYWFISTSHIWVGTQNFPELTDVKPSFHFNGH